MIKRESKFSPHPPRRPQFCIHPPVNNKPLVIRKLRPIEIINKPIYGAPRSLHVLMKQSWIRNYKSAPYASLDLIIHPADVCPDTNNRLTNAIQSTIRHCFCHVLYIRQVASTSPINNKLLNIRLSLFRNGVIPRTMREFHLLLFEQIAALLP